MSATTTAPPETETKEDDWESEWDGVLHFVTQPLSAPRKLANCGVPLAAKGEVIEPDEVLPNECPLCAAIHEEICARNP